MTALGVVLEAGEKISITFVIHIWQKNTKRVGHSLSENLGTTVDRIAKPGRCVFYKSYFVTAYIALPVEDIGNGTLGNSSFPRNIFDSCQENFLLPKIVLFYMIIV